MCFVDSSASVEIEEGAVIGVQYKCMDCDSRFKALGKKVSCPSCESTNVKKI